jgi:hypothetical protein
MELERGEGAVTTPDPERLEISRKLSAWHFEWRQKHGFDLDDDEATPEAIAEYMRKADEIKGRNPETGRYPDAPPVRRRRRRER